MSGPQKNVGEGPKRPPESPQSPKTLRETVSFYEKVWTGSGSAGVRAEGVQVDVDQLESRLAEEKARHQEAVALEAVSLRRAPTLSPRHDVRHTSGFGPDGSFQAGISPNFLSKCFAMRLAQPSH
ncbi:hypothetical protein HUJ04_002143 [Dendroctonus ponderosae]|nr:hypothetical protein HUJ04_002143 [Dendroctonus ponderosae]